MSTYMIYHILIATVFLVFSPKKSIVMTSPPWLSWFHAFLRWSLQHPPFLIPPSLLFQQRDHEIFSRRSGDRASLGFVPGMNLDLLGMNWYLDRFVPVSSMVTFRVIILPWPMGNPSNCPIWSRGHCVLWSFYLWIGSAFSKPENIFELRLLPISTFQIWIQKRNTVGCEIALWPKPLVFLDFYRQRSLTCSMATAASNRK